MCLKAFRLLSPLHSVQPSMLTLVLHLNAEDCGVVDAAPTPDTGTRNRLIAATIRARPTRVVVITNRVWLFDDCCDDCCDGIATSGLSATPDSVPPSGTRFS